MSIVPVAPITNIPSVPYPFVPPPFTDVAPLTYRDGTTYLEYLKGLNNWIQNSLIPYIADNLTALGQNYLDVANNLITEVNNALAGNVTDINGLIATINEQIDQINTAITSANTAATNSANSATQSASSATESANSATASANSATASASSATDSANSATNAIATVNAISAQSPVVLNPITGEYLIKNSLLDFTGNTDNSSVIQAAIDTVYAAGGGIVKINAPANSTIMAEFTLKHRVSIKGPSERDLTITAINGSTNPGIVQFAVGHNQNCWIEDLSFISNGNAGQYAIYCDAQQSGVDGGWWEGGMRRVHISMGTGGGIAFRAGVGNVPNQFLTFDMVFVFTTDTPALDNSGGSTSGQFVFIGGQFDGPGQSAGTIPNVNIAGGYTWTFIGTTFQNNKQAFLVSAAQQVTLVGCYFENLTQCITANIGAGGIPSTVTLINPHFANAGALPVSDGSGYLIKSNGAAVKVTLIGGGTTGNFDTAFIGGGSNGGTISVTGHSFTSPAKAISSGLTKQIAVNADGSVSPEQGTHYAVVNTSATQITSISSTHTTIGGDEITFRALNGTIIFAGGTGNNRIILGGLTSPVTVPQNGSITFIYDDLSLGWFLKSTSFE